VETIGSKRSYALTWCMPNNDDDDDESFVSCDESVTRFVLAVNFLSIAASSCVTRHLLDISLPFLMDLAAVLRPL